MDTFNIKALFPSPDEKYLLLYHVLGDQLILSVFVILFCIVGLVGNGNIVWLLGFRIKRKPFAIYVLNLAVADFGSLVLLLPLNIYAHPPFLGDFDFPPVVVNLLMSLFILMYSSRQLLLTAISIDRWVSVLFPNWYQCHRSPVLFTTVCAFIWVLSFVLGGVPVIVTELLPGYYDNTIILEHAVSTLICLLLVIISTLTLFIKVCLKSQRCQCGNLLKVIFLMHLSFLLFTILANVCFFTVYFIPLVYFGLWTSLNCSINPLIYFLAGRQNGGKFQERMKVTFQRVFKEERDTGMELKPSSQTML